MEEFEHRLAYCPQINDTFQIHNFTVKNIHLDMYVRMDTFFHVMNAGVGRTGTLIATDILLQAANAGRSIDVFSTVEELRKQRMNMVQTEEQYIYIHKLLAEHLDRPRTPEYLQNQSPIYENQSIINARGKRNTSDEDEEAESKF